MQAPFDNIVQHLFHQPSLHSVTVDELESMAIRHPYFAAAHFLLLKKMQDTAHPHFTAQLHKTTIYFNNPLWLQYLLQPETVANFSISDKSPFITSSDSLAHASLTSEEPGNGHAIEDVSGKENEEMPAPATEARLENISGNLNTVETAENDLNHQVTHSDNAGIMNVISDVFSDPNPLYNLTPAEEFNTVTEEIPAAPADELTEDGQHPIHSDATGLSIEETDTPASIEIVQDADEQMVSHIETAPEIFPGEQAETVEENKQETIAEASLENDQQVSTSETIATTTGTIHDDFEAGTLEADDTDPVAEITTDHNQASEAQADFSVQNQGENNITEKPGGGISLIKTIIETPAAKNDVLFEPYHTVDYFASQGIKLSKMEADSKDKLGRQLKSFTEWLKTMKKLPQVSINKILAENEESKVVEDANHSIETKEVITEAMAEVFEKQGLNDRAAEVYQKLSLLNPAKSAYFAARIEDLKH